MDENKDGLSDGITSNDFDYDIYSGGSAPNTGVTSGDFNYDVYSGSSAMEYLRQENERKREERARANKTEAELKREEYEKRFAGMSADEIFGMPQKKKKPEDDFSDFFDADEIERQQEKVRQFEAEVQAAKAAQAKQTQSGQNQGMPHLENMMPGEDTPSSQPKGMSRAEAMEQAAVMMAHRSFEREREDRRYHGSRRNRYYSNWIFNEIMSSILDSLGVGEKGRAFMDWLTWYLMWFVGGGMIYGIYSFARYQKMSLYFLVWGAVGGLVGGFVRRFFMERDTFLKAIVNLLAEFAILILLIVFVVILKVK